MSVMMTLFKVRICKNQPPRAVPLLDGYGSMMLTDCRYFHRCGTSLLRDCRFADVTMYALEGSDAHTLGREAAPTVTNTTELISVVR